MDSMKIVPIPYLQVIVSVSTILLIACVINMVYRFGKRRNMSIQKVKDRFLRRNNIPAEEIAEESDDGSYETPISTPPLTTSMLSLLDSPSEITLNTDDSMVDTELSEADLDQLIQDGHDDIKHDYIITLGEVFVNRYKVVKFIDRGVFGQVVKAEDLIEKCCVAIKITKSLKHYIRGAYKEIELLQVVNQADPDNKKSIVQFKDYFKWYSHVCLVFELLSYNLLQVLSRDDYYGLSLQVIKEIARQLFTALDFIHSLRIIHCDIKPENILFQDVENNIVKLIDFGLGCNFTDERYVYIQSRYYRAPEVMLGMIYGQPIDIWSLGCLLVELHVGFPLFMGVNEVDQMNRIIEVLGIPPKRVLDQSTRGPRYFVKTEYGYDVKKIRNRDYCNPGARRLHDILGVEIGGPSCKYQGEPGHTLFEYLKFKDLLLKMLDYNPETRISAGAALKHSFFHQLRDEDMSKEIRHANLAAIVPQEPRFGRPFHFRDISKIIEQYRLTPMPRHSSPTDSSNKQLTILHGQRDIIAKVKKIEPVQRNVPNCGYRHILQTRIEHKSPNLLLNTRNSLMPTSYIALQNIIPDKIIIRWELKKNKVVICNSRGMALRILDIRNPSLGIPRNLIPRVLKFPASFKRHNFFMSPPYPGSVTNLQCFPKPTLLQQQSSSKPLAIEDKVLKTKNYPDTVNLGLPSTSKQTSKIWKY